ncbi:DUF3899 domain-containing protein [Neobacillus niacini]|uniref:DUF3899 domain-containing protein n=1 Tax=Neobacillus niacini TaxID=86668 RepID=UPI0037C7ECB0
MDSHFKKRVLLVTLTQIAILVLSFFFYKKITLLSYINISFYMTAALLLLSLLIYTIQSGFYDAIGKSFNLAFSKDRKRKFTEIPSLSEMVTIDKRPLFFHGLVTGLFMLIALVAYYV